MVHSIRRTFGHVTFLSGKGGIVHNILERNLLETEEANSIIQDVFPVHAWLYRAEPQKDRVRVFRSDEILTEFSLFMKKNVFVIDMLVGDFRRVNVKCKYWENMRTVEIISDEYL